MKSEKARRTSDRLEKTREPRSSISIIETINSRKKETASTAVRDYSTCKLPRMEIR
jgi:hypothetical protein